MADQAGHATGLFDVMMMVDYSAKQTRGRRSGEANGIWLATGGTEGGQDIRPFRTRVELQSYLIQTLAEHLRDDRRVLLGLDFCLGFPHGTAALLQGARAATAGCRPWEWMWSELDRLIADQPSGRNNRFAVAAELNRRTVEDGPFWGRPLSQEHDGLATTKPVFPHVGPTVDVPEWRLTERTLQWAGSVPKSVWQLNGAGSVGGQSLVGIAMLQRVRAALTGSAWARRVAVWPFEDIGRARVVIAEVYPSLVAESGPATMIRDARQVRGLVEWFAGQDRAGYLGRLLGDPPSLDAAVREEEGWILGVPASTRS